MKRKAKPLNPKSFTLFAFGGLLLGALTFSGCGKSPEDTSSTEKSEVPAKGKPSLPVKEVEMTADDQMKYGVTEIKVQAKQRVKVVFKNIGTMPKQTMGHNFVLLKAGTDTAAFIDAGAAAAATDHIATELKNQVIVFTKTLGPGESETLTFTAPSEPGAYTYVCTFPAHFAAGMHGVLIVE